MFFLLSVFCRESSISPQPAQFMRCRKSNTGTPLGAQKFGSIPSRAKVMMLSDIRSYNIMLRSPIRLYAGLVDEHLEQMVNGRSPTAFRVPSCACVFVYILYVWASLSDGSPFKIRKHASRAASELFEPPTDKRTYDIRKHHQSMLILVIRNSHARS